VELRELRSLGRGTLARHAAIALPYLTISHIRATTPGGPPPQVVLTVMIGLVLAATVVPYIGPGTTKVGDPGASGNGEGDRVTQ